MDENEGNVTPSVPEDITPKTRNEALLYDIGGGEYALQPKTRKEYYLEKIASGDGIELAPKTREEWLLARIAMNNGESGGSSADLNSLFNGEITIRVSPDSNGGIFVTRPYTDGSSLLMAEADINKNGMEKYPIIGGFIIHIEPQVGQSINVDDAYGCEFCYASTDVFIIPSTSDDQWIRLSTREDTML